MGQGCGIWASGGLVARLWFLNLDQFRHALAGFSPAALQRDFMRARLRHIARNGASYRL